jgi:hypothetical protein
MMFNNKISIDGDAFKRAFCNSNNTEEDIGCWILVANYVHGRA